MKPKLSILVATMASRAAFWPWLAWNLERQRGIDWASTEILVSYAAYAVEAPAGAQLRHTTPVPLSEMSLGAQRNALLEQARGDVVAWFDDDDWHHPGRLAIQLDRLKNAKREASFTAWRFYLDLETNKGVAFADAYSRKPAAITFVGYREVAQRVRFPTDVCPGEDSAWLRGLLATGLRHSLLAAPAPLFIGLLHPGNTTHAVSSQWRRNRGPGEWKNRLGEDAWGDTDVQLEALRKRLQVASP